MVSRENMNEKQEQQEGRQELLHIVKGLRTRIGALQADKDFWPMGKLEKIDKIAQAAVKTVAPSAVFIATERFVTTPELQVHSDLSSLRAAIKDCVKCPLGKMRNQFVFGEGNPNARLMFVGEAPGRDEDLQGRPFVGRAGQLLTKIIEAMGMKRQDVYIANMLKCRPPNNRPPESEEMEQCWPHLTAQIRLIRPKVICALGSPAARALLGLDIPIGALRGKFHDVDGIPVMPTYHPAYLLRSPGEKGKVWEDMKMVMARLSS